MDLPELKKSTSAAVDLSYQLGMDGGLRVLVVIKLGFVVGPKAEVTRTPETEVRLIDELWDPEDPENSSIKFPTDICLRKPACDVIVVGDAMAKGRRESAELDVVIQVAALEKTLKVFGPRVWLKRMGGLGVSPALPAPSTPLKWELAYGGRDFSDPKRPLEEPRNPAGTGVAHDLSKLDNTAAPRVEDPRRLIKDHTTKPTPAGVGAIGRHWSPRREYTGTLDDAWQRERMPLLPMDFDERHNQVAPPSMILPGYLRGGEQVSLLNLNADGPMRFLLPRIVFFVGARSESGMTEYPPALDSLILVPNERRFELVWRCTLPVPRRARELEAVQVHEKAIV
jgi:hypothetical protein